MNNYIVVTTKEWHIKAFKKSISKFEGRWTLFTEKEQFNFEEVRRINPKYIFFTHWSWMVDKEITDNYNCICFHPTDLPYGRGGSPLQNLIVHKHKETKISAFRMNEEVDGGDIYFKQDLTLTGSAHEIFKRMANICTQMINFIITSNPEPIPQSGQVKVFVRRIPQQSIITDNMSMQELYDHIRMLDAPTYPKAFLNHGSCRIEFSDACIKNRKLTARVSITDLK